MTEIAPATQTTATDAADVVMQFRTQGGATVDLYRHTWSVHHYATPNAPAKTFDESGFEWRCNGCDLTGAETHLRMWGAGYREMQPKDSRTDANRHAETCRAMPRPTA
ncbi:hypothetical protein [Streptomyces enissocaesilis]